MKSKKEGAPYPVGRGGEVQKAGNKFGQGILVKIGFVSTQYIKN